MNPLNLENKAVIITGAGSGIGQALVLECARRGARIVAVDKNEAGLAETREQLKGIVRHAADGVEPPRHDAEHWFKTLDVADRDAVYALVERVDADLGGAAIVINNAGVSLSQNVADMDIEDFRWLMDINFWGVVYGSQASLKGMLARREGVIVNISSLFGLISVPTQAAYNASKFAVRGFTEALRLELEGTGVRAICVHPGGIRTNIVRNARYYVGPNGSTDLDHSVRQFEKQARTSPEEAAARILRAIDNDEPRVLIGPDARALDLLQRFTPVDYNVWFKRMLGLVR